MTLFEDFANPSEAAQKVQGGEKVGVQAESRVWDLPVRVFHWTLVGAFIAAFVTNKLGVSYFKYHVWAGYIVLVLVAFRLVWGLVGTRHARFWNFLRGPKEVLLYARSLLAAKGPHYAGHNPLGALMVLALLAGLGAQAALGLFANDEIFNVGPLYGYVTKDLSLQLTSLHRKLFYGLAAFVALHILAVVAHKIFKNENLVRAMITGRKPREFVPAGEAIGSSRLWLAIPIGMVLASALAWIVIHAPAAVDSGEF